MMRGLVAMLEKHHKVRILDEAVEAAVRLSHRYISGRQLPDKAVSVLDTACARVALGQAATPPAARGLPAPDRPGSRSRSASSSGRRSPAAQSTTSAGTSSTTQNTDAKARLSDLEARWEQERRLIEEMRAIRTKLEAHAAAAKAKADAASPAVEGRLSDEELAKLQADLARLNKELATVQGENPLMQVCVDGQAVAEVVSGWTGIPVGKMMSDEIQTVLLDARICWSSDHRPVARPRGDQPAHPDRAGQARRSPASRSACSCWSARAASARPRPRSPWPNSSTAASAT